MWRRWLWLVPLYLAGTYGTVRLARATTARLLWLHHTPAAQAAALAPAFPDAYQLYDHSLAIRAGTPLYRPWPDFRPDMPGPYPLGRVPYPPFITPALAPFMTWGFPAFAQAWLVLLLLGAVVYALCLGYLTAGRMSLVYSAHWLMALLALPPVRIALLGGNVEPLLWAAFGLALVLAPVRGPALAAIALVKLWAIWPLCAVASRRNGARGRVLLSAGGTALAAAAASALVLGPTRFVQSCLDWITYTLPVVGQGFAWSYNVSLSYAVLRVIGALGGAYAGGALPTLARVWLATVGVTAPLLTAWYLRRRSEQLQLAGVAAAAVLFSPVCWLYYLPIVFAAVAVDVRERAASGAALPGVAAAAVPS